MNLLKNADVIIYAGSLVNPELLEYAEDSCEIYNSAYMTLEEIIDVIKTADCASAYRRFFNIWCNKRAD